RRRIPSPPEHSGTNHGGGWRGGLGRFVDPGKQSSSSPSARAFLDLGSVAIRWHCLGQHGFEALADPCTSGALLCDGCAHFSLFGVLWRDNIAARRLSACFCVRCRSPGVLAGSGAYCTDSRIDITQMSIMIRELT